VTDGGTGSAPSLVDLAERLQEVCLARGLSVATAESCTGGRIAAAITAIAGSSGYYAGGVVTYADRAKIELLGVPGHAIAEHGAVSAQVARAMADGARARFGVDLAVAVTGVAGPGGGSAAKPVGLTYVGLASADRVEVRRSIGTGVREANQVSAARQALEWLIQAAEAGHAAEAVDAPATANREAPGDGVADTAAGARGPA
jgi:PncC family amidohydrolase